MRKSGRFLAAALSFALILATPLSAQATKSGLSDAKSKKTALEAEKKKTDAPCLPAGETLQREACHVRGSEMG